jgi:1-acyl-sn-glycerol-3-phosphate acyltransferase
VLNDHVELRTAALRFSLSERNGAATVADDVCWWGDAWFGPHLFRCLGLKGVSARIHFEDVVVDGADRFELSERSRQQVVRGYEELGREMEAEVASFTVTA